MFLISVIMSVFNAEKFLHEAISSIIEQSFQDFEFIIIDDASSDNSLNVIKSFRDNRIKLYCNKDNLGLAKNLNYGIKQAKGKYIARMDADDISSYDRLEKQFKYMEENPNVHICGTNAYLINEDGRVIGEKTYPKESDDIKSIMLVTNSIIHPSVMIKKEVLNLNLYNICFISCQDYELWARLISKEYNFSNLQEKLIKYRVVKNSITSTNNYQRKEIFLCQIFRELYGDLYEKFDIKYLVDSLYGETPFDTKAIENTIENIEREKKLIFSLNDYIYEQSIWRILLLKRKFKPKGFKVRNYYLGLVYYIKKYRKLLKRKIIMRIVNLKNE